MAVLPQTLIGEDKVEKNQSTQTPWNFELEPGTRIEAEVVSKEDVKIKFETIGKGSKIVDLLYLAVEIFTKEE